MTLHVLVMGAGSIGCFVGGRLALAGATVDFIARARVLQALRQNGLTLTDIDRPGRREHIASKALRLHERLDAGLRPDLVLLCVKSGATREAAAQLGAMLPTGTPMLSLQNGVSNAAIAAEMAPGLAVLAGMVPFNVAELAPGHYHRGTSGHLMAADTASLRARAADFERAGLPLVLRSDMASVQWGKLLLNLNNPVNALSGLPLRRQLLDRGYRQVTAALQAEALGVLGDAGIMPARVAAVPAAWMPMVLRLPTWLFRLVAARSLKIDEQARSSMADDLTLGRAPEIDALCGEVVRLARTQGRAAVLNERMAALLFAEPVQRRTAAELQTALGMA